MSSDKDRFVLIYDGHAVGFGETLEDAAKEAVETRGGQGFSSPSWHQLVDCAVYERRGMVAYNLVTRTD